ncbi:MAG: patatin-like phospholipase family protein [Betaproteobacteria bacterium]|nr:patatin-like phospholipase family protein [Betaproteobacteria bacterium]MDH5220410.1 patatin-like phospholipase family protein [Betaproteobacteria bacterium]MDH5351477.1 patatin-like phospholipase family protein [Betaproteobacteria bacterium]
MSYRIRTRDEHLANDGTPKRILALDGGGLRGILTTGFLQKIEDVLRARHGGDAAFRLCHYFDLIAGTSTGAIIAAALALGWSVEQIRAKYMSLGRAVFEKSFLRQGLFRAKYDAAKLSEELKAVYGAHTVLGSPELLTGLLVVTKRLDTGSPWPISNNPRGKYFAARAGGVIGNGDYPLWEVVRASTAAPVFFEPEKITIASAPGMKPVQGDFVDGGVSPYNNPALQALMYATLEGYRIGWPTGADALLLVSVGTGAAAAGVRTASVAAQHGIRSLLSLMEDSAVLQETMLQWMSSSATARVFDREIGDLGNDLVARQPLIRYLRYNVDLGKESVQRLDAALQDEKMIASLVEMDAPDNMEILHKLGCLAAERDVRAGDYPAGFDLAKA